ncbi:MAG TPA: oxidoreductase [Drouetiella sp.]
MSNTKVWFITGISRGLGKSLAEAALSRGDTVIGTSRNGKADIDAKKGTLHVLPLDVVNRAKVFEAVKKAVELGGNRLDYVVNNAGYGLLCAIEEATPAEFNPVLDVNFFGTVHVIQAALPFLRKQKSGHIINLSSIAGLAPGGGSGFYAAAKFAVEGLSISLAKETSPLGIKVTVVEPGAFRTDFLADSSIRYSENEISDYSTTSGAMKSRLQSMNGNQIGDPDAAAQALLKLVGSDEPPVHLILGTDSYDRASSHIDEFVSDMKKWKPVSVSTDYATAGAAKR